ncbi:MAG: hypothetical protein MK165_07050 [Pirellulaceae bacterium]|nr:hypothetical protein [Pirellulaceae bacterium]
MKTAISQRWLQLTLGGCGLAVALCATGCQSSIGGQILPSPYYIDDDVQYFAPGPEMKLAEEAAALKADAAERKLRQLQGQ